MNIELYWNGVDRSAVAGAKYALFETKPLGLGFAYDNGYKAIVTVEFLQ